MQCSGLRTGTVLELVCAKRKGCISVTPDIAAASGFTLLIAIVSPALIRGHS